MEQIELLLVVQIVPFRHVLQKELYSIFLRRVTDKPFRSYLDVRHEATILKAPQRSAAVFARRQKGSMLGTELPIHDDDYARIDGTARVQQVTAALKGTVKVDEPHRLNFEIMFKLLKKMHPHP